MASPFGCFLAGTPVLTPEGEKPIEQLQRGDRVRSRHEADVHGPVEDKLVEEVFVREGVVLDLTIAGQVIHTTPEHPFYSQDRGWTPAGQLRPGDLLATLDGRWLPLESARDTGRRETVYNLRVADFHTYFVGSPAWGFGVWVHNTYMGRDSAGVLRNADGTFAYDGGPVGGGLARPSLRADTRAAIEASALRDVEGNFLDSAGNVMSEWHYGHIRGFENRRILAAAEEIGLSQSLLNEYVNARPQFFQIEDAAKNLSHMGELPGIGGIEHILRDMRVFFST